MALSDLRPRLRSLVSDAAARLRSLWSLLTGRSEDRELAEELRFHVERQTEKKVAAGMSPAEARRQAHLELGGVERMRERTREARGILPIENLLRDVRLCLRSLPEEPAFSVVAIGTLAAAIAATTTVFTVVDAVLLDPLGFPDSDRLVAIRGSAPGTDMPEEFGPAPEFYVQYREQAPLLEDAGLYLTRQATMRAEERSERVFTALATPTLFTTLGVEPAVGRLFRPDDPLVDGEVSLTALLSHSLWSEWFGSDSTVVGRRFEIAGEVRTVIGVMPAEFKFPDDRTAVWIPAIIGDLSLLRPGSFGYGVVGRMTAGATHAELSDQLRVLALRLPERFGGSAEYARIIDRHRPVVRSLEDHYVGDMATPLWMLFGSVGIMLVVACLNVANLFLVRGEGRRRELSVRRAIGAARTDLVRLQVVEALVVALFGGAAGVLLARAALPALLRASPEIIPNLEAARLDGSALLFTVGISVLAAGIFGLLPALRFSEPGRPEGMRSTGGVGGLDSRLSRSALVSIQTALALVLLVSSGLLLRSHQNLSSVDPGYDTRNIFTFQIAPDRDRVRDGPTAGRFHEEMMARLGSLPGTESVGFAATLPLDEGPVDMEAWTEVMRSRSSEPASIRAAAVGGAFFEAMGIELERGRLLEPGDHDESGNVVVSEAAADLLWPGGEAVGESLTLSADTLAELTVVGVVEDIVADDLRQGAPEPVVFVPAVGTFGSPAYVVRSSRAGLLAEDVRDIVIEVAPEAPIYRVATMEELASRNMAELSFTSLMVATASALTLLFGAVGLFGVLSYAVSRRVPELAVRMALGARPRQVRRMVVRQGAGMVLIGVGAGLVLAFATTGVLESLLFGVGVLDLPTFAAMACLMLAVAFLATWVPAWRAASVEPMRVLKEE